MFIWFHKKELISSNIVLTWPSQLVEEVLVAAKAFTLPVLGKCGPMHRSISGPHLTTREHFHMKDLPAVVWFIITIKGTPKISHMGTTVKLNTDTITHHYNYCYYCEVQNKNDSWRVFWGFSAVSKWVGQKKYRQKSFLFSTSQYHKYNIYFLK